MENGEFLIDELVYESDEQPALAGTAPQRQTPLNLF
jgi:hypothetical protein